MRFFYGLCHRNPPTVGNIIYAPQPAFLRGIYGLGPRRASIAGPRRGDNVKGKHTMVLRLRLQAEYKAITIRRATASMV